MTSERYRRARWLVGVAGLLAGPLIGGGPAGAQQDAGPAETVTLLVRGPDGTPLRDHALTVFRMDPYRVGDQVASAQTDGQGRATVTVPPPRYPTGSRLRLRVVAPGVGFGGTGGITIGPDGRATAPLPPLAPFARLSGTVAPALRGPGQTVRVQSSAQNKDQGPAPAPVDAQGRFHLADLPPGQVGLTLEGGGGPSRYFQFQLAPGESRADALLSPPARVFPPYLPPAARTAALRGTVTDDRGRPVAGAAVSVQVPDTHQAFNLLSLHDALLTATAGADGGYTVPDVSLPGEAITLLLVATAPGRAPALAYVRAAAGGAGDLRGDLVLSTQHTALTVRVTGRDGKPVARARVSLAPTAGIPALLAPAPEGGPQSVSGFPGLRMLNFGVSPALLALFRPSGTTGPDGAARFVDLLPGLWDVTATGDPAPGFAGRPQDARAAESQGVAVQAGRGAVCRLALSPGPTDFTVRVLGPDGKVVPVAQATLEPGYSVVDTRVFRLRRPSEGEAGDIPVLGYQPGLWRVTADYQDGSLGSSYDPSISDPYTEAGALVALSSALPPPGLLTLHARPRQAGSLRVRLLGLDGGPATGAVFVPTQGDVPPYAATVDARGEAVFAGLPAGDYAVAGGLAGQPTPPTLFGRSDVPLPPDAALTGRACVVSQTATVTLDTETVLVLRARPAGFVRGRLVPAAGTPPRDYSIAPRYAPRYGETDAAGLIDPVTGEFAYGPLPPGPATLTLDCLDPVSRRDAPVAAIPVTVIGGQVRHLTPTPAPPLPPDAGLSPAEADAVGGAVFLSDGVTPAWGAQTVLFLPRPEFPQYPTLLTPAPADALGHLDGLPGSLGGYYGLGAPASAPTPTGTDPTVPTLVTWLPGLTGAVLLPYVKGREMHVVLPPANALTGRVTVGGRSPAGLPGALRVRAECQGRGRLSDLLSRDVNAAPDGTFTLPGMTPGAYLVQAARDGLWLSPSQTLVVGDGPLPALTLDIGPAGAPVTLRLSPGQAVALGRPAGPLADLLWPVTVRADGAGDLRLDGLEAGRHVVRPISGPAIVFNVPAVLGAPG